MRGDGGNRTRCGSACRARPLLSCHPRPAVLARDWSTWSGYLKSGRLFRSRIPHGPAFTDSAASLYSAMAAQAPEQYYSPAGRLALRGNPAIKAAWDTAV